MTLATVAAPLAAYALFFQTAVYFGLPISVRARYAPVLTGLVGAGLTLTAGLLFGFDRIGLSGGDPVLAVAWGLLAVALVSAISLPLIRRGNPDYLVDARLAALDRRQALSRIFIRIPVFTALIEEAFFRGVLHAALIAIYPLELAVWFGAGLFGLWHIGPGFDQARAGQGVSRTSAAHTVLTVIATTVAGAFLVWLRISTGSIWAPVAVHAAVNMTTALFSRAAATRLDSP